MSRNRTRQPQSKTDWLPTLLILLGIGYLALVLYIPALNVFVEAFKRGAGPFFANLTRPDFLNAVRLTLITAAVVVPLNTIFGLCAAWAITREKFPGRTLLLSYYRSPLLDFASSCGVNDYAPVRATGLVRGLIRIVDVKVVFSLPGIILATAFVSMPFVVREVIPVLEEAGKEQEEAAKTLGANDWQIFWRVTLPNIRWGLLYGLILTNARAMGEFGAVSVVSGNLANDTQTLPLFVEDAYKQYETEAAYSAAVLLAFLAVLTLVLKEIIERKTKIKDVE